MMRRAMICLISIFLTLHVACTYLTDFVIVNVSSEPIKVRYQVKGGSEDPFYMTDAPAKLPASQLSDSRRKWLGLSSTEYVLGKERREVTINLMPGEALRIAEVNRYGTREEAEETDYFPIEEIIISGQSGELNIKGAQVRKAFDDQDKSLYTLTYK